MKITEMSERDLKAVAGLCHRELVLDRDPAAIPGILTRRPHIGLIAADDSAILGACIGSVSQDKDEQERAIDLLVVDRAVQRRGVGTQLVSAMEQRLASRGCQQVYIAGSGPHYAWPGIDIQYTSAICFAEDLGYRRMGCEVNMDVDLRAPLDTGPVEDRLRGQGIEVRRAADDGPMQETLRSTWIPRLR